MWLGGLTAALVTAGAATAGLAWVWQTESGTRWALGLMPDTVQVEQLSGTLGGPSLSARRLNLTLDAGRLALEDVELAGIDWQWHPSPEQWLGLRLRQVQARQLMWHTAPSETPSTAPTDLRLPLALQVQQLRVPRLVVDDGPPLALQQARVQLGLQAGRVHRLDELQLSTERFTVTGQLQIGTDGPLPVQADTQWASLPSLSPAWQASVQASGPLAQLALDAHLRGQPQATASAPAAALDAQATLRPFQPWPVATLQLTTQALDLSALHADWPHTLLQAQAQVGQSAPRAPLRLNLHLRNSAADRWDTGALPLRALTLDIEGQWREGAALTLQGLHVRDARAELGTAREDGGQLALQGHWLGQVEVASAPGAAASGPQPAPGASATGVAELNLQAQALRLSVLDRRLGQLLLQGPVQGRFSGLPGPASLLDGWPAASTLDWRWRAQGQLNGRLETATQAGLAQLVLDAQGSRQGIELQQLALRAGQASATAHGQWQPQPDGGGRWQAQAALQGFDPSVWWPGEPGSPWQRGPHRLQAVLETHGELPAAVLAQDSARWQDTWQRVQAQAKLVMQPSELAGVALQGEASLSTRPTLTASGWLEAGGNRLELASSGPTQQTVWQLRLQAPTLATLAPLARLHPSTRDWAPQGGRLSLSSQWAPLSAGHWQWQASGQGAQLTAGGWQADELSLDTQGGSLPDAVLRLQLLGKGLRAGPQRLDLLNLNAQGSTRQHQLSATLESPLRPPVWFEQVLGARTGSGTRLQWQADGGWVAEPEAGPLAGRWQGRLTRLLGGARDGSGQPWLDAKELQLALGLNGDASVRELTLQPGQLSLPGTQLSWQTAQFKPGANPRWQVDARIEPFALAPLLARAQPELGWRGDLQLGGTLQLRRGDRFDAEVVFERQGGDLSISDDARDSASRVQPLGLSDLRLALTAHDGTWQFTQALAGRQLGEMAGVASVHTRPDAVWPTHDATLDGVLQMRVANLAAWGAWVPPGWRLGGELRTSATLGGRFGAPEVTGRLDGERLVAHHSLNGISLTDGRIAVRLDGAKASIEHFEFKGGEGRLSLTGDASLGSAPQATLQLDAERFQVLGRVDRRLVASGRATLQLDRDAWVLDSQARVDEGLIDFSRGDAPTLDDDVSLVQGDTPTARSDDTGKPQRSMRLSAQLDLGDQLRVRGRGLDALLRGKLKLQQAGGKLAVQGTVRAESGTYAAYGQKLDIERGNVSFNGPVDDPRLDIFAVRPNLDVQVGVAVTGSALNPRVRLASEPEMSDAYKLSWLVLGREPDGLGEADTALLQRAALALLAGEGEAPTDAFMKTVGITDFSVRQTTDSNDVRQTVVSLGKQLSRRWYVGYERGVNATTGTWQLIYRVAQRLTVRAQSGEDNAVDAIWSWRWP